MVTPTRFVLDPKRPDRRYVETEQLLEEGFISCPAPGEPLPPGFMAGAGDGSIIDKTTLQLAEKIKGLLSEDPTEEELKELMSNLDSLKPAEPVNQTIHNDQDTQQVQPAATGATGAMSPQTPPANESKSALFDADNNFIYPNIKIAETPEDAIRRWFNKDISQVTKPEISTKALKLFKVPVDQAKTKKLLIGDVQKIEWSFDQQK